MMTVPPEFGSDERWAARLHEIAADLAYPSTPDLTARFERRPVRRKSPFQARLAWVVLAMFVLVGGLLAVPPVRAGLLEFLQVGAVHIFLTAPTPTAAQRPASTPLASVLDLAGETTLAAAQAQVGFSIRLLATSSDLGAPDRVFLQDLNGEVVVLVWVDPQQPDRVRLSLHQLGLGALASKSQPPVIEVTTVNGQQAVWTTGPYILQAQDGTYDERRLIEGHVLVWEENEITYRLETDLSLAEAVQIAESLQ